jgi:hypothetical protein
MRWKEVSVPLSDLNSILKAKAIPYSLRKLLAGLANAALMAV